MVETQTGLLPDSVFLAIRVVTGILILGLLFIVTRVVIRAFVSQKSRELGAKRYWFAAANTLAFVSLLAVRAPAESMVKAVSDALGARFVFVEPDSLSLTLVGLLNILIATLLLTLLLQIVGIIYWLAERQLDLWSQRITARTKSSDARVHIHRTLYILNRFLRSAAVAILLLGFVPMVFLYFPRTRVAVASVQAYVGKPVTEIGRTVLHYIPNLGYLSVFLLLGWVSLRIARRIFNLISRGRLELPGFSPDWAEPSYRLFRTLNALFLLMVCFPYLPGASSQFFQGFSVFVGALVTFGSTTAIGNAVAGVVLTYTGAFRVGDIVKIGESVGAVQSRALLVTKLKTNRNEEIIIPNGKVLASTVLNYSAKSSTDGLVLTVSAGIGYDVDWRVVHRLMLEAASHTEHILAAPAPAVYQSALGDCAVNYELRAWTRRPELMIATHSHLRREVLDAFSAGGVEIMTPSVLALRGASRAAIPEPHSAEAAQPSSIAIGVERRTA